jgi:hypothetical protein
MQETNAGYISMQKTKWTMLLGTAISVLSSTALYANTLFWLISFSNDFGGVFHRNPWLNPLVFGINMTSILNDVGMMFVSGTFNPVLDQLWVARILQFLSSWSSGRSNKAKVGSMEIGQGVESSPPPVAVP